MTTRRVRHGIVLALVGLLAGLGLVAALYWQGSLLPRGETGQGQKAPAAALPGGEPSKVAPSKDASSEDVSPKGTSTESTRAKEAPLAGSPSAPAGRHATEATPATPPPTADKPGPGQAAAAPEAPRFDIVRVEPNGDAVVAGRGKPNTVVEMLVDGKPVARALTDPNGQFAIVPPPLPKGSSEIVLRSRTADGQESRSPQSVAVSVAPKGDTKPLVALTAPDAPTVVLSQPGAPEPPTATPGQAATASRDLPKPPEDRAAPARIVSVDSEPGGRLFVTGSGSPGAQVRLYLNDTLIAPATVGPDGRVTFTIGRGVAGGRYQVRLDQIDPRTGGVTHRAEVPFAMPQTLAENTAPRPAARPDGSAGSRSTVPGGATAQGVGGTGRAGAGQGAPETAASGRETAGSVSAGGASAGKEAAGKESAGKAPGKAPAGHSTGGASAGSAASRADGRGSAGATGDRPAAEPASPGGQRGESQAGLDRPGRGSEGTGLSGSPGGSGLGTVFVPEIATARITRGDNLWQISKRTYGRGERYTVIYDANQTQIRDPDLIYPGQIFVLPNDRRG